MNTNNKSKLFSIIIIALLLINTVAVSFLLLKKDKHRLPPPHPQQQGGAFNFLVKELKLDSSQIQQYQALRENHKNSADSIRQQKRKLKDSLFQLLKQHISSDVAVQQQLNAIAQNERYLDEITFNHFKQVRAICNAQQQTKFDEVIATAMRMQAPQRQHPLHHPNSGRPPRGEEPDDRPEDDNRPPPPQK
jgi:Spy/CpxP family protein refolding chaperone